MDVADTDDDFCGHDAALGDAEAARREWAAAVAWLEDAPSRTLHDAEAKAAAAEILVAWSCGEEGRYIRLLALAKAEALRLLRPDPVSGGAPRVPRATTASRAPETASHFG